MPVKKYKDSYRIRFWIKSKCYSRVVNRGVSKRDAEKQERKWKAEIEGSPVESATFTIADGVDKWIEEEVPTLSGEKRLLNHANAVKSHLKGELLDRIPEVIARINTSMQIDQYASSTIYKRTQILRRVAKLAYSRWNLLQSDICKKIEMVTQTDAREVFLSHKEVEAVADAASDNTVSPLIIFLAHTGIRTGELFRLVPSNFKNGILYLQETKEGKPRTVPLSLQARAALNTLDFPLPITKSRLRNVFKRACEACELENVRLHDLRHTFASWIVKGGVNIRTLQLLLGHKNLNTTARYINLDTTELENAVSSVLNRPTVLTVVDDKQTG